MKKGKFNILVDAAWGSSGKGAAAARLADIFRPNHLSASNFPNAGHTVVMSRSLPSGAREEQAFVFKVVPSAAALHWRDREYQPRLWIGPNSGLWVTDLESELVKTRYPRSELRVHPRAVQMQSRHPQMEAPEGEQSTEHISSTMSGSGAAYSEKAMRKENVVTAGIYRTDTATEWINSFHSHFGESRSMFLHEVSQGYALSINHGTHYPHCTFRDCTPQQACADFLIKPDQVGDVYLNVRSFPIRVGNNFRDGKQTGYSGHFYPDQRELSWPEVGAMAEMPALELGELAQREKTTVTKKVRRVATQSWQLCGEAARACGATKVILNFPQYIHWSAHNLRGGREQLSGLHAKVRVYMDKLEEATGLPIVMLGTGARHESFIYLD